MPIARHRRETKPKKVITKTKTKNQTTLVSKRVLATDT